MKAKEGKAPMTPHEEGRYLQTIKGVVQRYQTIGTRDAELERFMAEIVAGCQSGLPSSKLNRWLGYVQGVLIERGFLTVAEERDATRPVFRPLDFPQEADFSGGRTWYVSDTHFCHKRIIELSQRPFSDVVEMDEAMIANWNAVVAPGDTVRHGGDFATFGRGKDMIRAIFHRLNGEKHLIIGNHDEENEVTLSLPWASIQTSALIRDGHEKVFLSHYAHVTWPMNRKGAWHLYGHTHGQLKGTARSLDISVEAMGYKPVSLTQAVAKMRDLPDWPVKPDTWRR